MVKQNKIYKCIKCGNLIEKLIDNKNIPICCENEMQELEVKKQDSKIEKHIPFLKKIDENNVLVKIGESENHPMTEEHYIQFIEIIYDSGTKIIRHYLKPNDLPEVKFNINFDSIIEVREYCNLHGLWINKK